MQQVNQRLEDDEGKTVLQLAVSGGDVPTVQFLLQFLKAGTIANMAITNMADILVMAY